MTHITEKMTFGLAIEAMKRGERVRRGSWTTVDSIFIENGYIYTYASGSVVKQVSLNVDNILADDWYVVK